LKEFGVSADMGTKALAFSSAFSKEEVDELKELETPWSWVMTVLPVKDHDIAMGLLKAAARPGYSVRKLRAEVARLRGVPRHQKTRKPPGPPASYGPKADLHGLAKVTAHWRRHLPLWQNAAEELRLHPDQAGTEGELEKLFAVLARTLIELGSMQDQARRLAEGLARLQASLEKRAERTVKRGAGAGTRKANRGTEP
jgi:hypothetical protein